MQNPIDKDICICRRIRTAGDCNIPQSVELIVVPIPVDNNTVSRRTGSDVV